MFNTLKKRIKNEKGLSLVELLAVIVILGIIAAIAIPAIGNIIANSEAKAEIADATQILNAANIYFTDNPTEDTFAPGEAEATTPTVWSDYVESDGTITVTEVKKVAGGNKITFSGEKVGAEGVTKTLEQLNKATVSGGKINWE